MKIKKVNKTGGKDSLTLLHTLKNYQRFSPQKFELIAITLNPGGVDNSPLHKLCENLEIPFYEVQTDIKELVSRLNQEIPDSKKNIFGALNNSDRLFIWDKDKIK